MIAPGSTGARPRVLIAGGGVAALETLLALRSLAGQLVDVYLLCAQRTFVYRPMLTAEAFGAGVAPEIELQRMAADLEATLLADSLERVDVSARAALAGSGARHRYDALVVATGAVRRPWLAGAITFGDRDGAERVRWLTRRLLAGEMRNLVFAVPSDEAWTLPVYELALLASSFVGERRIAEVAISLITPEDRPVAIFGQRAGEAIHQLLIERGIVLRAGVGAARYEGDRLVLDTGEAVVADAVVTLPRTEGRLIPGLPHDRNGFLPVDGLGRVEGVEWVYAAGDGTNSPVKQGGLAAQQADSAASALLASLGAAVEPEPFRPVLRGMVLTGVTPAFLRSGTVEPDAETSEAGFEALWSPTAKVAARYLAPYLAERSPAWHGRELVDRGRVRRDPSQSDAEQRVSRDLARALAGAEPVPPRS